MAIITISRGSYSKGKEVAEKVARKLDYQCIAREIILKASKEYNTPEIKLLRAIHDPPSVLDRLTYGREKYIAYFQSALLNHLQRDNIIYHGLAGHFFLKGVSHTLKVRIISDVEDRLALEMAREGVSREQALAILKKDDEERKKWSRTLYGIDTSDSSLYDLVIRIRKITVDDAVDLICHAAGLEQFKTTVASQQAMEDLVLSSKVKAALIDLKPDVQVTAKAGKVLVGTRSTLVHEPEMKKEMERIAESIPGVKSVEIQVTHLVDWSD